jgi:hypothetical protein
MYAFYAIYITANISSQMTGFPSCFIHKWDFIMQCSNIIYPSPADRCFGSFRLLAVVNSAAMSFIEQIPPPCTEFIFLDVYPVVGLLDLMAVLLIVFLGISMFSLMTALIFPVCKGSLFYTSM